MLRKQLGQNFALLTDVGRTLIVIRGAASVKLPRGIKSTAEAAALSMCTPVHSGWFFDQI